MSSGVMVSSSSGGGSGGSGSGVGTEESLLGSGGGGGDPEAGDVALLPVAPLEREARFGSQATWRPAASG
jgi:hypothetical protein